MCKENFMNQHYVKKLIHPTATYFKILRKYIKYQNEQLLFINLFDGKHK